MHVHSHNQWCENPLKLCPCICSWSQEVTPPPYVCIHKICRTHGGWSFAHCEHPDNEAVMVDPCPSLPVLKMGLLWQTHTLSCTHPHLRLRSYFRPLGLSLHSQTESSPWVCPLKPEGQHPVTVHTSRCAFQAGQCGDMARIIYAGLSLPCGATDQLLHSTLEPLKLPVCACGPSSQGRECPG